MKNEQIEPFPSLGDPEAGHGAKLGWAPGVTELLDHLAQELALEYIRLMEQAVEAEDATFDGTRREEE